MAYPCNFGLLRRLLIRGFAKVVLRVLYVKMGQLRGSSSMELKCPAQLLCGSEEAESWGLTEHAARSDFFNQQLLFYIPLQRTGKARRCRGRGHGGEGRELG